MCSELTENSATDSGGNNQPAPNELLQARIESLELEKKKLTRQLNRLQLTLDRNKAVALTAANLSAAETRERRRQERFMDLLLENSPDIIMIFEQDARLAYCTDALLKRMGIPGSGLIRGRLAREIFSDEEQKSFVREFEEALDFVMSSNVALEQESTLEFGGERRDYTIHISPMLGSDLNSEGAIAIFHDFTEILKIKDAAEEASRAKSSFLTSTSHEIRTPLNAIIGMCELILREDLTPVVSGYATGIKQAGANLLSIINNILDLSKIEAGKMEIVLTDYQLASLINDVVNVVRARAMEKSIQLLVFVDPALPGQMYGDEVRIRQVIINLLTNAVKYTQEGFVFLSISSGRRLNEESMELVIAVQDSGIGVKEEDKDKLFSSFVQVNLVKNKGIESTGLGLSITRRLCQAMGGNVTFTSTYGEGSTFTIVLPQKIVGDSKIVELNNPEPLNVLLYVTHEMRGENFSRSLSIMGVSFKQVRLQSEFYEALLEGPRKYSHIFVEQTTLEGAFKMLEKMEYETTLISVADYGEQRTFLQNVRMIPAPVHSISIATMLNNEFVNASSDGRAWTHRFIAPTARVLLVDDISTNLLVAEGLMLPYKIHVDTCQSGADAIEMVKKNRYDVVFMDHMMPEMDGIEATTRIRTLEERDEYFKKLPIIALTANVVSGMKEMFLANGMDDYLAKPIDLVKMDSLLDKWLPAEKKLKHSQEDETEPESEIEIEGLSVKTGIAMTGGSLPSYIRVLRSYCRDGREKTGQIRKAYEDKNLPLFATYVHALKSASASIGSADLSTLSKDLEFAAKREDTSFIAKNIDPFFAALEPLLLSIEHALSDWDKASERKPHAGAVDRSKLQEQLQKLKQSLDEIDISAIDAASAGLAAETWDSETKAALDLISEQILIAEYDEATRLIDEMLA
ncbi:hypothetical protein FACS1894205_5620 [Alphaproteobacteria bacterium]|nr:hypothetical protein FACS1894205_5620 [Alphaproteobacteria bacterium]